MMSAEAIEARREYGRRYRAENRERLNAYKRKWRRDNPEKVKAYQESAWERAAARAQITESNDS